MREKTKAETAHICKRHLEESGTEFTSNHNSGIHSYSN